VTPQAADALARRFNLERLQSQYLVSTNSTVFRWVIPGSSRSVSAVIGQLEANGIKSSPNYFFALAQAETAAASTASAPADKVEGDPAQYALGKLRLPLAHSLAKGDQVLVAVIDSGVDTTHQEFAGVIADTFDVLDSAEPPHAHGTAIAGAIAAHSRLMGVAPSAKILAIRAFGESTGSAEGTTFNIIKSIDWAIGKGAQVINMSFAGPKDPALARRLVAAREKGIVLIAAVGNAGAKSPPLYPGADPNVIAVTATDSNDQLFSASNRGDYVAIAAPGVDILLPAPGGAYQVSSGTSFAAAHVSGIAALILERKRDLKPDAVRKILLSTAKDLGPKGRDIYFGAGLADAYQAVTATEAGGPAPSNASASR
jgi:subtilisin family serine protease